MGGCAELVAVKATCVARKPPAVSHVEAAALPCAGLTAGQALRRNGRVRQGDRVGVVGAWWDVEWRVRAVTEETVVSGLNADWVVGGEVRRDGEGVADVLGHFGNVLARALGQHLLDDARAGGVIDAGLDQGALDQRAGVGEVQVCAAVVGVAKGGPGGTRPPARQRAGPTRKAPSRG